MEERGAIIGAVCGAAAVAFGLGVLVGQQKLWFGPSVHDDDLVNHHHSSLAGEVHRYVPSENLPEGEKELWEEQLSRCSQFLGNDGLEKLDKAFVVVVGVGGVGSHCAHLLARSGVRRLRVIDFDNVTLSSLNRHAVAGRDDVGTPKVVALARHIRRFAPYCEVDARPEMFIEERAHVLLEGKPDYVVDCIDDRNTKVALLAYCLLNDIKVISSMAAGAKADPSRIHFTQFREVVRDPLAARLRWNLKQYLKHKDASDSVPFDKIEVVYSSELPHMKLLPLDAEVAGEDPSELGTVPNFRVRVMPVLGTMPAIFGMAMAARVITQLAEKGFVPVPAPTLKHNAAHKFRQKLGSRVAKLKAAMMGKEEDENSSQAKEIEDWAQVALINDDDCAALVSQFCQRCPVTQSRMGSGPAFELIPWRYDRPIQPDNLVLCATKALDKLEEMLVARQLPTHKDLGISQEDFADILYKQHAVQTERQFRIEKEGTAEFDKVARRATAHMNKDHAKDCLTLVRAYGECPSAVQATMKSLDRLGMVFTCIDGTGASSTCRVLFPSRLVEAKEIRETVVKLTLQGREKE